MPLKSKVKFTDAQSLKNVGGTAASPNSPNNSDNIPLQSSPNLQGAKSRKSKKASKTTDLQVSTLEVVNDADSQFNEDGLSGGTQDSIRGRGTRKSTSLRDIASLLVMDCDKDVSDGSVEDEEVPEVQWPPPPTPSSKEAGGVCPFEGGGGGGVGGGGQVKATEEKGRTCNVGVRLTVSEKITPCMKSDDEAFSTTDYNRTVDASAGLGKLPNLIHPLNGQVSVKI